VNVKEFYDGDSRRRGSAEVAYGLKWQSAADRSVLFGLHWVEDTREIYALREPQSQWIVNHYGDAFPVSLGIKDDAYWVEILGWAETEAILDEALEGWEAQMDQPDSLQWVRSRLKDAEARTAKPEEADGGDVLGQESTTLLERPLRSDAE
jgi:hypothetical protein